MKGLFSFLLLFNAVVSCYADEGMWIPLLLEKYTIQDMQQNGFQLSAEDIYSINNSSLKDAVVIFGGGCTGEIVSDEGLIFTNHHCGYSWIQSHSSIEKNYLAHGFWAMNREEELPNPGLTVTFLEKIEDVSDMVLENTQNELTEAAREKVIRENIDKLKQQYGESKYRKVTVKPFYYGNEYYMFIYKEYTDVRLVGAPPSGIGNFGRDMDNWMWPRHTGDFSVFRVYADKNNQPADYSPNNVPLEPVKFLPISIQGYKEGDFTMVMGYPANTTQFYTSSAVRMLIEKSYPQKIELRAARLKTMEKYMSESDIVRIQYSAKYNRVSNAWKKWQGVMTGLEKVDALQFKLQEESEFRLWANGSQDRKVQYGDILDKLDKLYKEMSGYILVYEYANEAVLAVEIFKLIMDINNFIEVNFAATDEQKIIARNNFLKKVDNFFKDYYQPVDEDIYEIVLRTFKNDIDQRFYPPVYDDIEKKYNGNYRKFVEKQFKKTIFCSPGELKELLMQYPLNESLVRKKLDEDPMNKAFLSFAEVYNDEVYARYNFLNQEIDRAYRMYVKGIIEMNNGVMMYPDANFTMRVAYGKVEGYSPRDAVKYDYSSTLSGAVEKFQSGMADYTMPVKLIELYVKQDFGLYSNSAGDINICFVASNHTSGGNSGSPVLNSRGELIGLNFDRNWEGTMSDIFYDPSLCRNITVDIRYVLFIIDKFAGAGYLLEEMVIL